MKKTKHNISDWLEKHGNKDIENQVKLELESINKERLVKKAIEKFCDYKKLNFVEYIKGGFIATKRLDNMIMYRFFTCYSDGKIIER